jgi:hypothetical protein
MSELLRVADKDVHGFLAVDLLQLLNAVTESGPTLDWVLQELTLTGNLRGRWTVQRLETASREPPYGLRLSWAETLGIAEMITQVQEGVVIGLRAGSEPPSLGVEARTGAAEVVLEAVDSSYWEVYAKDNRVAAAIRAQFRCVTKLAE